MGASSIFGIGQMYEYPRVTKDFRVHFNKVGSHISEAMLAYNESKESKSKKQAVQKD
jgi:hypothetical protein